MKMKKWQDFIVESVLYSSDRFTDYLEKINDRISRELISLLGKDIKTKYNFLDVGDVLGDIFFRPDSKSSNDGLVSSSKPSKASLGRVVGGILTSNSVEFTTKELEDFVRKFKAIWMLENDHSSKYQIVEGEDIRKWYSISNYSYQTTGGQGTLGKSCMRYKHCSKFFDIYVLNPSVVKMLILLDENNKLRMRMLVWNLGDKYFLDRCYYTLDTEEEAGITWLEKNLDKPLIIDLPQDGISVKLERSSLDGGKFEYYPFMDSLKYYNPKTMELQSDKPETKKTDWYLLNQTDGSFNRTGLVWCDFEQEEHLEDECVWSSVNDTWILQRNAIESSYHGGWIFKGVSVWSEKLDSWIIRSISREAWTNLEKTKKSWLPANMTYSTLGDGRLEYWDTELKSQFIKPQKVILDWLVEKYPVQDLEYRKGVKSGILMDSEVRYNNFLVLKVASKVGIANGSGFSNEIQNEILNTFFSSEESGFNMDINQILADVRLEYVKIVNRHLGK